MDNKEISYKSLFCEKNYMKNFMASIVSRFGDSIDALAFSWLVYELTGSASWLAIVFGVNALPTILFQPFAGVLVDNFDKKRLMVLTDLGRAITVLFIALLSLLGLLNPWILMACTFINSTLEAFRIPTGIAVYPKLLPKEKYSFGMALSSSASRISEIVGLASAGIIVGLIGTGGALIIDAVTFLASAIILSFLKLPKDINEKVKFSFNIYKIKTKEGFKYFYNQKIIFAICIIGNFLGVLLIPFNTMQAAYINESLKLQAIALSASSVSLALGLSFGSYICPLINKKTSNNKVFIIGGFLFSIPYILFAGISFVNNTILVWLFLVSVSFIAGIGAAFTSLIINIAFMNHVEEAYLARVGGLFNSMASAATPLASFIIAAIAKFLSVVQLFLICGILCLIFFTLINFNKYVKQL